MSARRPLKAVEQYSQRLLQQTGDFLNIITVGRVTSIALNETDSIGGWNDIGVITYDEITSTTLLPKRNQVARPLDPSLKKYPLENELVYVINLPSTGLNTNNIAYTQYYVNTINLWNHPHHNGFPSDPATLPIEQQKDYDMTIAGSPRRVLDKGTDIVLGKTFEEKPNIHPLLPYEGDVIMEGRWGNSVRFGSTVPNESKTGFIFPTGTTAGRAGDPITIIRNGQSSAASGKGWIPITEDINKDPSSIYLTSTQRVPLQTAISLKSTYSGSSFVSTETYQGPQIMMNSGRIVLNAGSYEGSILLTGANTVGLEAQRSINLFAKTDIVLDGSKVKLGGVQANEPILKGNQTVDLLEELLVNLYEFMLVAKEATYEKVNPNTGKVEASRIEGFTTAADQFAKLLPYLVSRLGTLKSEKTFTV